jgi:hypothetical protein
MGTDPDFSRIGMSIGYAFLRTAGLEASDQLDEKRKSAMYEAPSVIGICMNCIARGSLSATLALTFIGASILLAADWRKRAFARANLSNDAQTR